MVETVHLVQICRWTAPQPHEVTRPRESMRRQLIEAIAAARTAASGRKRPSAIGQKRTVATQLATAGNSSLLRSRFHEQERNAGNDRDNTHHKTKDAIGFEKYR